MYIFCVCTHTIYYMYYIYSYSMYYIIYVCVCVQYYIVCIVLYCYPNGPLPITYIFP